MSIIRVSIDYTNWRGERAIRTIAPRKLLFGMNEWHPEPQWLLEALDIEKGELRTFAMSGIHRWESVEPPVPRRMEEE